MQHADDDNDWVDSENPKCEQLLDFCFVLPPREGMEFDPGLRKEYILSQKPKYKCSRSFESTDQVIIWITEKAKRGYSIVSFRKMQEFKTWSCEVVWNRDIIH